MTLTVLRRNDQVLHPGDTTLPCQMGHLPSRKSQSTCGDELKRTTPTLTRCATLDPRGGRPACAMNPWLFLCLVASVVGAWSAIHAQGVSEDCCLDYHPCVGPSFLRNVAGYRRQEVSGSCNLPAVIFFFTKDKMLCANPRDSWVQKMMVSLDAGNNTLSKYHRRHLYGALPRCRKSSTGISKLPPPKFRRPPRRNKRKTSLLTKVNPGP